MRCSLLLLFFTPLFSLAQWDKSTGDLLQNNHAVIQVGMQQYDPSQYNLLVHQQQREVNGATIVMEFKESNWQVITKANPVINKPNAVDFTVAFYCKTGSVSNAALSANIVFNNWSPSNYVLMPAVAYNGNRYPWRKLRYSPKLYEVQDIGPDKPIILTDVPKLSDDGGFSRIQQRSGDFATPSVGFQSATAQKAMWMLTEQGNSLGDYGIGLHETRDRKQAVITITSPVVREQYVYKNCDNHFPSWDQPHDFKAGDSVVIHFRLYDFEAPVLQDLFTSFASIRKDIAGYTALKSSLSYTASMQLLEKKFNEKNFVPKYGYYSVGFRENFLQDWQIGWTGGMISTYPLLFAGSDSTVKNVLRNFDWLFPNGISPSGFYWDAGRNGTEWLGGDIRKPHTGNWHLVRKSGDAIWYIVKQFMLMEKRGIVVKQSWKQGNKTVCDAFVKLWNRSGQLGQFVNSQTGEIIVGGSTSGAIVPAALALAAKYYNEPQYLIAATSIANYYYNNFTSKGITCGGPGDAVQNFDSESAAAMVESFVTLYEATKDKQWLLKAEHAATQFATWVVSYNYQFPDSSAYAKANIHVMGSVYANTQNKHTAPGICTGSGVGLLKLYKYTGNRFYLDLLRDIAYHIPQYLGHPLKPLGNLPAGFVSERINMNDWEGPETIGYVLPISTWAETSLMLTTIELPGLFIQPEKGVYVAFDNIEVKQIANTNRELVLQLRNATPIEAVVTLLEDHDTNNNLVLGENFVFGLRKITLRAGKSTTLKFKKRKTGQSALTAK